MKLVSNSSSNDNSIERVVKIDEVGSIKSLESDRESLKLDREVIILTPWS